MAELKISEMVVREMNRSETFTKENFGLQIGSGFPELARELISSKAIQKDLLKQYMHTVLSKVDVPKDGLGEWVRSNPSLYQNSFSYLYWGIQIGRELQKLEMDALNEIAHAAKGEQR